MSAALLKRRDFELGCVERHGRYVRIAMIDGVFHVHRHPEHPYGHAHTTHRLVAEARRSARELMKEVPRRGKNEPAVNAG